VIFSSKETNNQVSVTSVENNKITNSQIDAGQAAASGKYDSAIKTIDEQLSSTTDNDIKYRLFMQKSAILVNKSDLSSAYDAAISAYKISKTANSAANVAYVLAKMNKNSDAISYYKIAISLIDSSDPMSGTDKTYYQSLIDNLGK
jgi:tetratricopeptide (TPR) repeat protein